MWKGFWHSTFGIVFCWVPLLGLILSISGFARQAVRMTGKHKARLVLFVIYGLASLALSIGLIVGGLYEYSRDPQMPQKVLQQMWTALTGQATLPGQPSNAYDYGTSENPGFGVYTDPNDPNTQMQPEDFADEEFFPEDEVFDEEFEDAIPDDTVIEGDAVPDDVVGSEIPSVGDMRAASIGGDGAEFVDPLDDELFDEDYVEEDLGGYLDFGYEVVEDPTTEVEGLVQVDYKVAIDKEDPTEDELETLFYEVISDDGYDLHNMAIYRDASETSGDYTVAIINEGTPGADPTITMK